MKNFFPALLLFATGFVHAWGTSGLPYYQQYQNGSLPPSMPVQQPDPADNYNQGYTDGYNEAHGLIGRHGYGPRYQQGYDAARSAEAATYRLNHPY